jgi:hypothetical protein
VTPEKVTPARRVSGSFRMVRNLIHPNRRILAARRWWIGQMVLDPFRFVLIAVAGWINQRQLQAMGYLKEENRVLRGATRRAPLAADRRPTSVVWLQRPRDWEGSCRRNWPRLSRRRRCWPFVREVCSALARNATFQVRHNGFSLPHPHRDYYHWGKHFRSAVGI